MSVPDWYEFALLSLASYRTFRLLAVDKIFDKPRTWVLNRLDSEKVDEFVSCPYCLGGWISAGWFLAWQWQEHAVLVGAAFMAVWALQALVTVHLDP